MSLPFLVILFSLVVILPAVIALVIALPIWICWGIAALFRKVRHRGR
jgi:hypothetical protein